MLLKDPVYGVDIIDVNDASGAGEAVAGGATGGLRKRGTIKSRLEWHVIQQDSVRCAVPSIRRE